MQTGFELTRQDAFPLSVCQPDPLPAPLSPAHLIPTAETCYHPPPPPTPAGGDPHPLDKRHSFNRHLLQVALRIVRFCTFTSHFLPECHTAGATQLPSPLRRKVTRTSIFREEMGQE